MINTNKNHIKINDLFNRIEMIQGLIKSGCDLHVANMNTFKFTIPDKISFYLYIYLSLFQQDIWFQHNW